MLHYRWRELDFSKLYNHINDNFDTEFYNKALNQKRIIEINMKNEAYIRNRLLNKTLHKNEVACAILYMIQVLIVSTKRSSKPVKP